LRWARSRGVGWWVNTSASPSPYLDLSAVIRALRGAVGGWGGRGLLSQALMLLLYRRLGDIGGQMERLAARFQAGRLWRLGPRLGASERVAAAADGRPCYVPSRVWPGRFGWLVRLMSYQAAGYGSQLRVMLGQPDMVALLLAAPQAARILRPICRMLAVETSLLRPRPEGAVAEIAPGACSPGEVVDVVRKRVCVPRVAVDWGRIPLPKGVLAAARRQGFRKGR
jgi:hypothetical protein